MATLEQIQSALEQADAAVTASESAGNKQAAQQARQDAQRLAVMYATAQKQQQPKKQSASETGNRVWDIATNSMYSWLKYGADIYNSLTSPIDTAEALGKTAVGGVQMLAPDLLTTPQHDYREYPRQLGQYYADRYGSPGQAWESFVSDPAATLGDLSLVGGTGGGLLSLGGKMSHLPKMQRVGQAVTKGSVALDPMALAFNSPKPIVSMMTPEGAPARLYQKAAKFTTTKDTKPLIQTALDQKIMPTPKGAFKGYDLIEDLEKQQVAIINAVDDKAKIPISALTRNFDKLRKKFGGPGPDKKRNLKIINKLEKNLKDSVIDEPRSWVTPKELQKIKSDLYNSIDWNDAKRKVENVGRKRMAREAQEILEDVTTRVDSNVADVNKPLSDLYALMGKPGSPKLGPLPQSANRIGNLNLVSLGTPLRAMSGAGIGHLLGSPLAGFAIGAGLAVADIPRLKARIAIALNNVKKAKSSDILLANSYRNWLAKQTGIVDRAELDQLIQQDLEKEESESETE